MNLEHRSLKVFHVSVRFNKVEFMISLFILLFNVSFILSFLLYTLLLPFLSLFFFFCSRVILDKFSMGHFAEFHISKGTTNAADIFTSLNFYWFYACVCVCVLCRFVCSLSSYICALLSSPSLGKKRFYVQYFIMAVEKDTLGVRAASK